MPRRKVEPDKPLKPKKPSEFKFKVNYDYSNSVPCVNKRCNGFMFMIITQGREGQGPFDCLECFNCKRTKKLGPHNPKRPKPV
jgi:hypothetical protein